MFPPTPYLRPWFWIQPAGCKPIIIALSSSKLYNCLVFSSLSFPVPRISTFCKSFHSKLVSSLVRDELRFLTFGHHAKTKSTFLRLMARKIGVICIYKQFWYWVSILKKVPFCILLIISLLTYILQGGGVPMQEWSVYPSILQM